MPHSAPSNQSPTVFISYAHESDALRASVAALAEWLGGHGCRVFTDHPFVDRPPPEGWQAWMLGCIDQAETVLVVCMPKLKGRYEKTAAPDAGRGATYEGAIVTQRIYDAVMRNTKFFPILPNGGTEEDIPTALKSWWNGHRFPGGNEGIRRMVFAEPVGGGSHGDSPAGSAETAPSPWPIGAPHERLAARLLGAAGASPFFQALQGEMAGEFPGTPAPQTGRDGATVHRMSRRAGTGSLHSCASCLTCRAASGRCPTGRRRVRGRAVLPGRVPAGGRSNPRGARPWGRQVRDRCAEQRARRLRHHRHRAVRRRVAPDARRAAGPAASRVCVRGQGPCRRRPDCHGFRAGCFCRRVPERPRGHRDQPGFRSAETRTARAACSTLSYHRARAQGQPGAGGTRACPGRGGPGLRRCP